MTTPGTLFGEHVCLESWTGNQPLEKVATLPILNYGHRGEGRKPLSFPRPADEFDAIEYIYIYKSFPLFLQCIFLNRTKFPPHFPHLKKEKRWRRVFSIVKNNSMRNIANKNRCIRFSLQREGWEMGGCASPRELPDKARTIDNSPPRCNVIKFFLLRELHPAT